MNMETDELRTVVSLVSEELFTLFRSSEGQRHCYILGQLYDYVKLRSITVDPLTGRRHTTENNGILFQL